MLVISVGYTTCAHAAGDIDIETSVNDFKQVFQSDETPTNIFERV
jgi:hypothetical protein